MQGPYLSPAGLAERYGVPVGTVYMWNTRGTGPRYIRIGKHVRYPISDVEEWEKDRYQSPTITPDRKAAAHAAAAS